ncbi:MAG: cation diffusion facilitator family transporter [Candidatus Eisenbacteria bacterium]
MPDGARTSGLTPRSVTWSGIVVNVVLSLAKVGVGLTLRSNALLADGLHSVSDLVTDSAVLVGLRISSRPADEDHHYGHRRVTTLVTLFVGAALLATAGWIVYNAIVTYGEAHGRAMGTLPFWVALLSIAPKELLYRLTIRVGRDAGDTSVIANAWHHRSDAFTSIAAAAGLAGVAFGGPEMAFLDHLTAVVLSAFLAVTAFRFISESVSELIDVAPDAAVMERIDRTVSETPGVVEHHQLRLRKMAGSVLLDVHVHVDPELSVVDGHDIASEVQERLLGCGCNVVEAVVHVEPAEDGPGELPG